MRESEDNSFKMCGCERKERIKMVAGEWQEGTVLSEEEEHLFLSDKLETPWSEGSWVSHLSLSPGVSLSVE